MTNKIAYISGTAKWAKLDKPDDKYGGSWQLDLYPDTAGWEVFDSLNLELKVRDNEETQEKYVKLRRSCQKIIKQELVKFEAPAVVNTDAKPLNALVGNGSKVICKIVVYPTAKGNAHRLESVMVTDLVEYNKTETVGANDFAPF